MPGAWPGTHQPAVAVKIIGRNGPLVRRDEVAGKVPVPSQPGIRNSVRLRMDPRAQTGARLGQCEMLRAGLGRVVQVLRQRPARPITGGSQPPWRTWSCWTRSAPRLQRRAWRSGFAPGSRTCASPSTACTPWPVLPSPMTTPAPGNGRSTQGDAPEANRTSPRRTGLCKQFPLTIHGVRG